MGKCFCEPNEKEIIQNKEISFNFFGENNKKNEIIQKNSFQNVLEGLQKWIKPNKFEDKFKKKEDEFNKIRFFEIKNTTNSSKLETKNKSSINNSLNLTSKKKEIKAKINQNNENNDNVKKNKYFFENSLANLTLRNQSLQDNNDFEDVDIVHKISEYGQEDLATLEKYPFKPNVDVFSDFPYQPPQFYEEKIPEQLTQIRIKSDWEDNPLVVYKDYEKKNLETPIFYTKNKNPIEEQLEEDFQKQEKEIQNRKEINNYDGNYFYLPMIDKNPTEIRNNYERKEQNYLKNTQFQPKIRMRANSLSSQDEILSELSNEIDKDLDKMEFNYEFIEKNNENENIKKKYDNQIFKENEINEKNTNKIIENNMNFENYYQKNNENILSIIKNNEIVKNIIENQEKNNEINVEKNSNLNKNNFENLYKNKEIAFENSEKIFKINDEKDDIYKKNKNLDLLESLNNDLNEIDFEKSEKKNFLQKQQDNENNQITNKNLYEKLSGIEELLRQLILIEKDKKN